MSGKAKLVPIATKAAGSQVIRLEEGATVGATIGLNLFMPDGTVVHAEEILNKFAGGKPTLQDLIIWKQLAEVPANVRALAAAAGTGLFAITGPAVGAFRAITEVAGETAVANGDGVAGNPTVGLADVVPAAGGTLQKTQFDAKGRRSHEGVATTDDLAEGAVNLYHTNARVDARIAMQKGQPNGLAPLDAGGKLDGGYLPDIAITNTFVVASQAAMLALVAQEGDVAVRTDLNKSFILTAQPATVLANWQELLTPTSAVTSVFGRVGAVVAQSGDYTFAQLSGIPTTLAGYGIVDAVNTFGAQNIAGVKTFTSGDVIISGAAGTNRLFRFDSGSSNRWIIFADSSAESGGNAGSNLTINAYDDAGAFIGSVLNVRRSTQAMTFSQTPAVGLNAMWHAGNMPLDSGTYIPTLTHVTNVSSSSASVCQYMRVGNVVTVSGRIDVGATAIGAVNVGLSLPIASAFSTSSQAGGTATTNHATKVPAFINADAANDRAQMQYNAPATGSVVIMFQFTYLIV